MTQSAPAIRIGVVGAGNNTRERHLPNLLSIPGVSVVSVANRRRESAAAVAASFNIPRVYDDWRELVAAPDSDAIVIGTWPNLHCEAALAALAAGKHVLCEARMAMNLAEAREMLAAARAHPELVAQLVPAPFTFGVDATIRAWIDEGRLGELYAIDARLAGSGFADAAAPMTWRHDRACSGNNIMGMGIWYESLLRWVGEAESVFARGKVCVARRINPATGKPETMTIPDHLDISCRWSNGAQAHLQFSTVTGLAPSPAIYLYGSQATLCYDVASRALLAGRRGDGALTPVQLDPALVADWRVEEEFIGAIRGTETVRLTTFEDGVRYMRFTEAVAVSLAESREVRLGEL